LYHSFIHKCAKVTITTTFFGEDSLNIKGKNINRYKQRNSMFPPSSFAEVAR